MHRFTEVGMFAVLGQDALLQQEGTYEPDFCAYPRRVSKEDTGARSERGRGVTNVGIARAARSRSFVYNHYPQSFSPNVKKVLAL